MIGLATPWYLKKAGADPFVIEAKSVGGGCSHGNLGWISPSVSTPLALPELTWKSMPWMLRRDGPLFIRPAAVPRLLPWLMRFRSRCNRADWERGIRKLAALNARTSELYDGLRADGVDFELARSGMLLVFRNRANADEKREALAAVSAVGASVWREVDESELYEREPLLRPGFVRGFFVESDFHVRPETLTAGKGYTVTIEGPENQLRQPLFLGDPHIGLTPFEGAVRFGGTMELSGVNERLDRARVRSLRRMVCRDVDVPEAREGGREWVGMRPMLPDTLPLMGRVPSLENVYVNTGHQMLGVTLAPGCGRVVAGMVVT